MCCITFNWKEGNTRGKFDHFRSTGSVAWAVIELTDFCNFNCEWCYAGAGYASGSERRHMPLGDLKLLIDTLADSGTRQVTYSGGEPMMYPYLREAISYAHDRGLHVHMNTNAYLLTKEKMKELMELGLSQIETNIDSVTPERHDRVRGMPGSFSKSMEAVRNAADLGMVCVVQTVMTRENEHEIIDIARLARDAGAQRYRLWDVMLSGHAHGRKDMRPTRYVEIVKSLAEFAASAGAWSLESGEPLFPLEHEVGMDVIDFPCVCACGLLMNISAAGDAYFCCTYREPLYNVFDALARGEKLREYHASRLAEFLTRKGVPEKCASCRLFEKCRGGCLTRTGYTEDGVDYWCEL